jgi:hypothetical protein
VLRAAVDAGVDHIDLVAVACMALSSVLGRLLCMAWTISAAVGATRNPARSAPG